jgi:hypothetical protein
MSSAERCYIMLSVAPSLAKTWMSPSYLHIQFSERALAETWMSPSYQLLLPLPKHGCHPVISCSFPRRNMDVTCMDQIKNKL